MPLHGGATRWDLALRRLLGRFEARLFLSACIVVSLLPLAWARALDPLFLGVFAAEFLLRCVLVLRSDPEDPWDAPRWRLPRPGAVLLLGLDMLALVSFLPLATHDAGWTRLLRVIRLLALLSYWAPFMNDLRVVLLRRERSRQVLVMGALVGLLSFTGALVLDQLRGNDVAADYDGDDDVDEHDHQFAVHLWWAFRQIQDPGNMLEAPEAAGAVAVSVVLTVFGLFLVSFLIGLGTDVVRELMTVSHLRPPGLEGHTVIVHVNAATRQLLHELVRYYKKLLPEGSLSRRWLRQLGENARRLVMGPRYVVVGSREDRPGFLRRADFVDIVYRQGTPSDRDFMARADIARAHRILVLADTDARDPDAETIRALLTIHDGLHALRERPPEARPVLRQIADRRPLARASDGHALHARGRLLIAEILDDRNLPAAWAAISYGAGAVRTFVVHVERLVGLLLVAVARVDGVTPLLEELLSCTGHEIYTCFFEMPELAYHPDVPPTLPARRDAAMATLQARAAALPARRFLIPLGLLHEETSPQGWPVRRAALGQGTGEAGAEERHWAGFVAVAPNFAAVRDFAESLRAPPGPVPGDRSEFTAPTCERAPDLPLRRILVCGFRAATVGLLEALVLTEPAAEILVLLDDEAALAAAVERLRVHRGMAEYRTLTLALGSFAEEDGVYRYRPRAAPEQRCGRVRLAVGDRTSLLQLLDLPHGFGHAGDLDLALLMATRREDGDARTTEALLALEVVRTHGGRRSPLRVVAEVVDAELCNRLRRRARQVGDERVQVFSLEALRASFLFQSVLIPAFNLVYGELLGPWGHSLARKPVRAPGRGRCAFAALAAGFAAAGELLLGVEVQGADGRPRVELAGGDGNGGEVELAAVTAVWVLAPDPVDQSRGRCVDGPVA